MTPRHREFMIEQHHGKIVHSQNTVRHNEGQNYDPKQLSKQGLEHKANDCHDNHEKNQNASQRKGQRKKKKKKKKIKPCKRKPRNCDTSLITLILEMKTNITNRFSHTSQSRSHRG
jgi:hypothetical protein